MVRGTAARRLGCVCANRADDALQRLRVDAHGRSSSSTGGAL
jgi:hypothetical protein